MKTMKFFLAFLFGLLFLLPSALFADNYGLRVAGIQVTEENKDSIVLDDRITGYVSYDPETMTLTLDNASIRTPHSNSAGIINDSIDGLIINLIGVNRIIGTNENWGIYLYAPATIRGDELIILAEYEGIFINQTELIVDSTTLTIESYGNCAIAGFDHASSDIYINYSIINAISAPSPSSDAGVYYNVDVHMVGCWPIYPYNKFINDGPGGGFIYSATGDVVQGQLIIAPTYGFEVLDIEINPFNKDEITSPYIDGHISYDPATKTLTLDNATIHNYWKNYRNSIYNYDVVGLTINVVGTNNIYCYEYFDGAIYFGSGTSNTITGGGTLNIFAGNDYGITSYSNQLTIRDVELNIQSNEKGIYLDEYSNGKRSTLIIENATVRIDAEDVAVSRIDTLQLVDCEIVEPEGAFYDPTAQTFLDEDSIEVRHLLISPTRPIDPVDPVDPIDPVEPGDTTSIAHFEAGQFALYPNPANDVLHISGEGFSQYEIVNFIGQVVLSGNLTESATQINIAELPAGVYIVRLQGNEGVAAKKFSKM